ncbi:MAG: GNAT family N-acetyltransferase, partial [Desulfobulbaceae bacterium]|nr:GNAT family N-acetyltransferase [Desulfobulbaceae bacterium]
MPNILYGKATSTDIPELVELKLAMFAESCHADKLAENAKEIILEDYCCLYEENKAQHFVARKDNRILGCVGAFVKSDLPYRYYKHPTYGFIGDVYTVPDSRNIG